MTGEGFSPKTMLRARRPEHFSDSFHKDTPSLHRSFLEYHMATLTSRSQEKEFEEFVRRLAEQEICPNLTAHTGPDAGGDSKADTETYPVAEGLREIWYWGWGDAAGTERWAIAVSTQQTWKAKVKKDVKKLVETGRGYSKIIFFSNQSIRDKDRAAVEDELTTAHGVEVRIFSLTWILDKIFEKGYERLAVEYLKVPDAIAQVRTVGPRDAERQKELDEVEARIKRAAASGNYNLSVVDDCIYAAYLVRSIDTSRERVDGCYSRAIRIADQYGSAHHKIRARYEHCWTTYFWHEDLATTFRMYSDVEELALASDNVYDLELLSNLRTILATAVHVGALAGSPEEMNARTERLQGRLKQLAEMADRPSSALQARSISLLTTLTASGGDEHGAIFAEFQDIVQQAEGLLGFPLEPLVDIVVEIGQYYDGVPRYEQLYENLINIQARRSGDIQAAKMLLRRGYQQFGNQRYAESVRSLGRAFSLLFKYETRGSFASALDLCTVNYRKLGLLWAARGTAIRGAYVSVGDFWSYSTVRNELVELVRKAKWSELELGRIPQALSWHRLQLILSNNTPNAEDTEDDGASGSLSESHIFDASLGILLLRSSIDQLSRLSRLPSILERLGLFMAACCLRYALGDATLYDDLFNGEGQSITKSDRENELFDFFSRMLEQPAAADLPPAPELCTADRVRLEGVVLGCTVSIDSSVREPALTTAENVLAALQAFLAIGLADRTFPLSPKLTIAVDIVEDEAFHGISHTMREIKGYPHIDVAVSPFDPHLHSIQFRRALIESISQIIIDAFACAFTAESLERVVVPWFRDDDVMNRAVGATASFGAIASIFGNDYGSLYMSSIDAWMVDAPSEVPLARSQPWNRNTEAEDGTRAMPFRPGVGPAPDELRLGANTPHSDVVVHSLIRIPLWDRANWHGAAFAFDPVGSAIPPTLALLFKSDDAGREIFTYLQEDVGAKDTENRLRVVIIRGVSRTDRHAYRILIGSNIPDTRLDDGSYFLAISRYCEMTPSSGRNLNGFLQRFEHEKIYLITCSRQVSGTVDICFECGILKSDLVVRWAYEIGLNDLDGAAIRHDDDVYIPAGVTEPAIKELLAWKQAAAQPESGTTQKNTKPEP